MNNMVNNNVPLNSNEQTSASPPVSPTPPPLDTYSPAQSAKPQPNSAWVALRIVLYLVVGVPVLAILVAMIVPFLISQRHTRTPLAVNSPTITASPSAATETVPPLSPAQAFIMDAQGLCQSLQSYFTQGGKPDQFIEREVVTSDIPKSETLRVQTDVNTVRLEVSRPEFANQVFSSDSRYKLGPTGGLRCIVPKSSSWPPDISQIRYEPF